MSQLLVLHALSKRASLLGGMSQLLSWDQETYMPQKAACARAKQIELLAELSHAIKAGPEFERALKSVIELKTGKPKVKLSAQDAAQVRLYRRDFLKEKKLPASFVEEFARYTSESVFVWQKAKNDDDFQLFRPRLEKIVGLVRKKVDYLGYKDHPYDALIDECEKGMTTHEVASLFAEVKSAIQQILTKTKTTQKLQIPAPPEEQLLLCHQLLKRLGFDYSRGRLDLSSHPFCSSYHPYDSRITARLESKNVIVQVLTTLHEAGHSFYAMGLPVKFHGTPLGQAVSCGIHESQSRFWETLIGRSKAFWKPIYPALKKLLPKYLSNMRFDEFMAKVNRVTPSLIRTDADEVTYQLHVILRFELEQELINGTLKVKELPERWNTAMKELLGITPKTNREGCLQDIHWAVGAFGYFPTYTLGNLYAAQMFEAFAKRYPDWEKRISSGDFTFIKEWLHEHLWRHGRRFDGKEIIRKITGKNLSAAPFIRYLTSKYAAQPFISRS